MKKWILLFCACFFVMIKTSNAHNSISDRVYASDTVCAGGSILLTASAGTSYLWSTGATTDTTTVHPTTDTTYYAIVKNGNTVIAVDTFVITVYTVFPAFTSTAQTICAGQSITFTDTSNFAPTNWYWQFPGGTPDTSTAQNPTIQYDTAGTYSLVLTAWNGGCDSGTKTFTDYVTVAASPNIFITPDSLIVCLGSSVLLTASGGITYQWIGTTDTSDTITVQPQQNTTYKLLASNGGCSVIDSSMITVTPGPSKPTVTQHDSLLMSSATEGNQWYRNDTLIPGATNQDYIVTIPGYYLVSVTDSITGCSAFEDSIFFAGIHTVSLKNCINIFPNPFNSVIILSISSSVAEVNDWFLQITDVLGRRVYIRSWLDYSNDIDLSNLPNGMYFVTVISKTDRVVVTVVKE